jgi:hypothetical protein
MEGHNIAMMFQNCSAFSSPPIRKRETTQKTDEFDLELVHLFPVTPVKKSGQ